VDGLHRFPDVTQTVVDPPFCPFGIEHQADIGIRIRSSPSKSLKHWFGITEVSEIQYSGNRVTFMLQENTEAPFVNTIVYNLAGVYPSWQNLSIGTIRPTRSFASSLAAASLSTHSISGARMLQIAKNKSRHPPAKPEPIDGE